MAVNLDGDNLALWRTHPYRYNNYLFILKPTVVLAARVNQSSFTYSLAEFTFDTVTTGAYGDVKPGMTICFGTAPGLSDLGRQRVRKAFTSTIGYIGWSSRGDKDGEVNLADNAYVTVYDDYRIWAKTPRILDDGTMYKDYDIPLGSFGTDTPPKANGGMAFADFIDDDSSVITVPLSAEFSFSTAPGAAIASYAWDIADGSIVSGDIDESDLVVEFSAGFRWVTLTVTDTNDQTHTTHIPIVAAERTGINAPITNFAVRNHLIEAWGTSITFEVFESLPEDDYPTGTLVLYWEEERYGTTRGSIDLYSNGRANLKFMGWQSTAAASIDFNEHGAQGGTELVCLSPTGRLRELPGYPQILENSSSPADWSQTIELDLDRYIFYLLFWHSTAFDVCEYIESGVGSGYDLVSLQSDGQSLYDQVNQRAGAFGAVFNCEMRGRLRVAMDPLLQEPGNRIDLSFIILSTADYTGPLLIQQQHHPRTGWLTGAAIVSDAFHQQIVAVKCIAPGSAPGQGSTQDILNYQVVSGQDELNARTGHDYARRNSIWPRFTMTLNNTGDGGIDPAQMLWLTITTRAEDFERGWAFTDQRCLVKSITINHSNDEFHTKEVTLELEVETVGFPAQTVIIPPSDDLPEYEPPYTIYPPSVPDANTDGQNSFLLGQGIGNIAGVNSDGYLYRTHSFSTPSGAGGPTWDRVNLSLDGSPVHFVVDAFSDLYITGSGTVNGWVATTTKMYYVEDLFGTPTVTEQKTFRDTCDRRSLDSPFGLGNEGRVYCMSAYDDGTYYMHTQDGGTTWSSEAKIGDTPSGPSTGGGGSPSLIASYDFTVDDQGWVEGVSDYAEYSSGVGWGIGASSGTHVIIKKTISSQTVGQVRIYLSTPMLDNYNGVNIDDGGGYPYTWGEEGHYTESVIYIPLFDGPTFTEIHISLATTS